MPLFSTVSGASKYKNNRCFFRTHFAAKHVQERSLAVRSLLSTSSIPQFHLGCLPSPRRFTFLQLSSSLLLRNYLDVRENNIRIYLVSIFNTHCPRANKITPLHSSDSTNDMSWFKKTHANPLSSCFPITNKHPPGCPMLSGRKNPFMAQKRSSRSPARPKTLPIQS